MQVEKINFQQAFPIEGYGTFLQQKLGIDIILHEGDTAEQAFDLAKKTIEDWHAFNNGTPQRLKTEELFSAPLFPPKEVNLQHEAIEIALDNATSFEQLSLLKPSCTTPALVNQYMQKMKELTSKIK